MKQIKFITLFTLFLTIQSKAQISIGVQGGAFKNVVKSKEIDYNFSYIMHNYSRATAGIVVEKKFIPSFSSWFEVDYFEKEVLVYGFEDEFRYIGKSLKITTTDFAALGRYKIKIAKDLKLDILGGPSLTYALSGKSYYKLLWRDRKTSDEFKKLDFNGDYRRITYGYQIGGGLSLSQKNIEFFTHWRFVGGFNSFSRIPEENFNHRASSLLFGVLFRVTKS